jgi:hypothetical protein
MRVARTAGVSRPAVIRRLAAVFRRWFGVLSASRARGCRRESARSKGWRSRRPCTAGLAGLVQVLLVLLAETRRVV